MYEAGKTDYIIINW